MLKALPPLYDPDTTGDLSLAVHVTSQFLPLLEVTQEVSAFAFPRKAKDRSAEDKITKNW
ncbi:hypothetical protein [Nitrosomonas sp. wSCUT-2]